MKRREPANGRPFAFIFCKIISTVSGCFVLRIAVFRRCFFFALNAAPALFPLANFAADRNANVSESLRDLSYQDRFLRQKGSAASAHLRQIPYRISSKEGLIFRDAYSAARTGSPDTSALARSMSTNSPLTSFAQKGSRPSAESRIIPGSYRWSHQKSHRRKAI